MSEFVYNRETRIHTLDGARIPSSTQVLCGTGWVDPRYYPEASKIRGKRVHSCSELLEGPGLNWESLGPIEEALGEPVSMYVRAYESFLKNEGWQSEMIEKEAVSVPFRFCGCADRIGRCRGGKRTLMDVKTGLWVHTWQMQLGSYEVLYKVGRALIVELRPDGTYRLEEVDAVVYAQKFLCLLEVFREGLRRKVYEYGD